MKKQRRKLTSIGIKNVVSVAIIVSVLVVVLVLGGLNQPLMIAAFCAGAFLISLIIYIPQAMKISASSGSDTPIRRYRVGVRIAAIGVVMIAAALVTWALDMDALPRLLAVMGIGGSAVGLDFANQAKKELRKVS